MASTKFNFGAMGEAEVINNYKLTDEDLKNSEEVEEDHLEYENDEAEQYMSIAELKSKMKKKSDNIKNKPMNKININSTMENRSHSRSSSKINKKMGRQVATINSSGNEALRRTYLIEIANIKRLEEIKVYLYANEVIQYTDIVNKAIEHYYSCMKIGNEKK